MIIRKLIPVFIALVIVFLLISVGSATNKGKFIFSDKSFTMNLPDEIPNIVFWSGASLETSSRYFFVNYRFGFLRFHKDTDYYDIFMYRSGDNMYPFIIRAFMNKEFKYWYYVDGEYFGEMAYKMFLEVMAPMCAYSKDSCESRGIEVM